MRCFVLVPLAVLAMFVHTDASDGADQVPLNLALGKPAVASSAQSGNGPDAAVDGDNGTRWCASDDSTGHWWQVDLQQPEDLTSCRINWEFDGIRYRYKIEASPDGKTWSALVDGTGKDAPAQREQTHKLDANGVRFVRVTVTGLETGRWASFHEFELYGGGKTVDPVTLAQKKNASLLREIKAPANLKLTLFAAPPDVSYPVCLTAAANGDVFVAVDPNGSLDQKTGRGKILRCRDTDGDGAADQFITFAQLDSPRGMVWDEANATMYVVHPPRLTAFHDDNGDGVADRRDVLVEGLGFDLNFRGADHTTNGLQIGIDGWLYMAVGDYGFVRAKKRDGYTLQLHGGGVVRVRTDGTRLEIVSRGQRNIYDVAISPTMDLFTRDNTNDGDGWDERLSHVVPLAQFGYPSLFKNFSSDVMKPLAEYGGGSPTGAIYLDEPGLARGLYTCDWGTNRVDLHPLTRKGASFAAEQKSLIEMPRPVDIDVDGNSNLYIASWRGGGFSYSGPDVGYVVRLADPAHKPAALPNLREATDEQLLAELSKNSHVRRLRAQREIVRRGADEALRDKLHELAAGNGPIESRAAALFCTAQLRRPDSYGPVTRITGGNDIREFALPALVDRATNLAEVPTEPFFHALKSLEPRIRLQGVIGIARLGISMKDGAHMLLTVANDPDPAVAHAAIQAMVKLQVIEPCLHVVRAANRDYYAAACRVLQHIHEPAVVDELIRCSARPGDRELQRLVLATLCRLYYREAEWTGGWWGTRPDTSGPYYSPTTWQQSDRIMEALRKSLAEADPETRRSLLVELLRHKIDMEEAVQPMISLAGTDPSFEAVASDLLASRPTWPKPLNAVLFGAAASESQDVGVRARALAALARSADTRDGTVVALSWLKYDAPAPLLQVRGDFVRDARHTGDVSYFEQLSKTESEGRRELAFAVLLHVATNKQSPKEAAAAASKVIDVAKSDPSRAASLNRAMQREKMEAYGAPPAGNDPNKVVIAKIPYEQTLETALKHEGDAKHGAELFVKQSCVACHTVSKNEPPKGPFLGDIGKRYNRAELIESILKPNAKIAQGFVTHYFITKKRERTDGFIVREAGDDVEIRTATGTSVTIKSADVARKGTLPTSIMPEQLADNLSVEELASLVAYLESLKGE